MSDKAQVQFRDTRAIDTQEKGVIATYSLTCVPRVNDNILFQSKINGYTEWIVARIYHWVDSNTVLVYLRPKERW